MSAKLDDLLLNDRGFAFDAVDGESYQLSPTALQLVRWMQAGDLEEAVLLDRLMDSYEVDEHTARRDLDSFLSTARELGWS
ncbi:MAG: PqqD family protein [Verrucomicrobiales bacterium]|nr:PqqD family protein [Verrucomicrobiales bacterium]MCP5558311.1 PqqD family protein [Verrucomicrobiaceae bacterium]